MHGDTSTADIGQGPGETGGVEDVDPGKIERLKNLLADTKSLSTPDQKQQINDLVA